jgi:hypothetical protein
MNAGGIARLLVACCAGFVIAAAAVWALRPSDSPVAADSSPLPASRASAAAGEAPPHRAAPDRAPPHRDGDAAPEPATARVEPRRDRVLSDALGRFDATRLRDAGFGDREIEQLGERILRLERDAVAERDAAQRRGERPRHRRLSDRIWAGLRAEYGDEITAALLFAANQVNRVEVEAVAASSPAESAGLRTGDVILYCDRQRILNPQELRELTRGSRAANGGIVLLEVLRAGERLAFDLPSDLAGVRVSGSSAAPAVP